MPRRIVTRWNRWLPYALVAGIAAFTASAIVALVITSQEQQRICMAQNENRATIRQILVLARDFPRPASAPPLSRDERAAREDFYKRALGRATRIDCRRTIAAEDASEHLTFQGLLP